MRRHGRDGMRDLPQHCQHYINHCYASSRSRCPDFRTLRSGFMRYPTAPAFIGRISLRTAGYCGFGTIPSMGSCKTRTLDKCATVQQSGGPAAAQSRNANDRLAAICRPWPRCHSLDDFVKCGLPLWSDEQARSIHHGQLPHSSHRFPVCIVVRSSKRHFYGNFGNTRYNGQIRKRSAHEGLSKQRTRGRKGALETHVERAGFGQIQG
jgi:hypothetical protein